MSNVKTTFTGDNRDLLRAMDQLQRKHDALQESMKKGSKESVDGANAQTSAFSAMASSLTGVVASFASIGTAVQLVRSEFEEIVRLQERSHVAAMNGGVTSYDLARMLPAGADVNAVEAEAVRISGVSGISLDDVHRAIGGAASAKGELPLAAAIRAVEATTGLVPEGGTALGQLAQSGLDVAKVTGGGAEANLSLVLAGLAASRVTSLDQFTKNVVPRAMGATEFGDTAEQSLELAATLTQLSGDQGGERSGTLLQSLGRQLREFLPGGGSTTQRLNMLYQDRDLAEKFLAGSSFGEGGIFIEALLSGRGRGALAAAQEAVPTFGDESFYNDKRAQILALNSGRATQRGMIGEQAGEAALRARPDAATLGEIGSYLSEGIESTGGGFNNRWLADLEFRSRGMFDTDNAANYAINALRVRQSAIVTGRANQYDTAQYRSALGNADANTQQMVRSLDTLIGLMQQSVDELHRQGQSSNNTVGAPNAGEEQ